MRVRLETLGCRLNEAELETWARQFRARGFGIAAEGEPADLVVVNTCAVTGEAVRKSRQILRRVQRGNPAARLVVSGCLASLEAEAIAREQPVDLVVANRDKERLVELSVEALGLPSRPPADLDGEADTLFTRGRQRAFIKVQDGCRHRCTFCIVTLARGEERSRPVREVVAEINRLAAGSVQEVVLTGVHLGGYGSDIGSDLLGLLGAVLADTPVARLRLGSLEPWDIPDGLWGLFASPRLMPHLHLPLQSGSDAVLRRMARRGRARDFAALATAARERVPELNLTTDLIVGFPGETEAEWRETLGLVAGIGFGQIHAFPYSPRAGTRAARLRGQVPADLKRTRAREIQALAREARRAALERQVGGEVSVLVERPARNPASGDWLGYNPSYFPVRLRAEGVEDLTNRIVRVRITGCCADGDSLLGAVCT
jgi:threonylcarbamoyladenosine tRNA methylthiotransferase MtaB